MVGRSWHVFTLTSTLAATPDPGYRDLSHAKLRLPKARLPRCHVPGESKFTMAIHSRGAIVGMNSTRESVVPGGGVFGSTGWRSCTAHAIRSWENDFQDQQPE